MHTREESGYRAQLELGQLLSEQLGLFCIVARVFTQVGELRFLFRDFIVGFQRVREPALKLCALGVKLVQPSAAAVFMQQLHPRRVELGQRALCVHRLVG